MRDPLVAPLAAIATGILITQSARFSAGELLLGIAALTFLALISLRLKLRAGSVSSCLTALLLAGALLGEARRPGPTPVIDASSRELLAFEGCVVEPPRRFTDREQVLVELAPRARARVSFYLNEGDAAPGLRYGQRIGFDGRARRPRNFGNEGAFDFEQYLARRGIYWTVSARPPVRILGECGDPVHGAVFALREKAAGRIQALFGGSPYHTAMLQAILLGDDSRMETLWTDDFRATGTFHVLVISGAHIGALAVFCLMVFRLILPRLAAGAATAGIVWLYALGTGAGAPVVRASVAMSLFLMVGLFYRRGRPVNVLAAVALGFLIADPASLFDASFQLSFLAAGFLTVFAVPMLERTVQPYASAAARLGERRRDLRLPPPLASFRVELRLLAETASLWLRLPERATLLLASWPFRAALSLAALALVSAVVQLGFVLPMAAYFHRFSWSGLTANVTVLLLTAWLVPLGFLAIAVGSPALATPVGWILDMMRATVAWHAGWEAAPRVPDPPAWLGLLAALMLVAGALWAARSGRALAGFALAGLAIAAVVVAHPFTPRVRPGWLELTAIDVGQGDSLLVAFPDGRLLLVDGGGIPTFRGREPSRLDIGEDVVSPYLWSRSIRRLDAVALTHTDQDHIGGLEAILSNFRPSELWVGVTPPAGVPGGDSWLGLETRARQLGVRIVPLHEGAAFAYGAARIEALWPARVHAPRALANDLSLVLRVSYGARSFLLGGDIERRTEAQLVERNLLRPSDVLKVPHHGSRTSSGDALLDRVHPGFAIVSAGYENVYRHPHQDVVDRFFRRHTELLRTDRDGRVTIRTDGRRMEVETYREAGVAAARLPVFDR